MMSQGQALALQLAKEQHDLELESLKAHKELMENPYMKEARMVNLFDLALLFNGVCDKLEEIQQRLDALEGKTNANDES